MPKPRCPACKIILDGGRLVAALRMLAEVTTGVRRAAAIFFAGIVEANTRAIQHGIESGKFNDEQIDEAHAWSELQCHRAAFIEDSFDDPGNIFPDVLRTWATEDRVRLTKMVGGEYSGAWTVDGTKGISPKKGSTP